MTRSSFKLRNVVKNSSHPRRLNLRNVATIVACLSVCAVMSCGGCKKSGGDDDDNGGGGSGSIKLSPPAWIQGSWGDFAGEIAVYKFTADDFLTYGSSIKVMSSMGATIKEETKTDALYEVKVTTTAGSTGSGSYSFKKGDGTYIEAAAAVGNEVITPSDYVRLNKK